MVERDTEVKDLRAQNEELKTALQSSAQLLNEVMTAGGSGGGPPSLQALTEPPGLEPGEGQEVPLEVQPVDHQIALESEAENLKGVNELAPLPELSGDTGVEFSDWLYVAEQAIGAMSDSASLWFERTLGAARDAYARYQMASPLERLAIAPKVSPELLEPKWVRLDRKVMTLVLNAMPKTVKEDAVTHRVTSVATALYRLHVLYSPGGTAERAAILKHLEGASAGESISEVIAALRKWRRYLTRSAEMQLTAPDPSILLKGVETIIAACVQKHGEMSFRLSLARNELQLQNRPTNETVLRFYDHALAEMQQALPVKWANKPGEQPRIKAIGAGTGEASTNSSPTASPNKGSRGTASTTPCKFFLSE
ncbi:unnamed protein product, partial [Symbiodinium necroappetens]